MKHIWQSRSGRIGLVIVGTALLVVLVSLVWTPHDPSKVVPADRWLPISRDHWFGTDGAGKDLFSQVLVGARTTLFVVLASVAIAAVIGLVMGIFSALAPRWVGESTVYLIDVLIALPGTGARARARRRARRVVVDRVVGDRVRRRRRAGEGREERDAHGAHP